MVFMRSKDDFVSENLPETVKFDLVRTVRLVKAAAEHNLRFLTGFH